VHFFEQLCIDARDIVTLRAEGCGLLDDNTFSLVAIDVSEEPAGRLDLKGGSEPVITFSVYPSD
jgi:hypothetical protein